MPSRGVREVHRVLPLRHLVCVRLLRLLLLLLVYREQARGGVVVQRVRLVGAVVGPITDRSMGSVFGMGEEIACACCYAIRERVEPVLCVQLRAADLLLGAR